MIEVTHSGQHQELQRISAFSREDCVAPGDLLRDDVIRRAVDEELGKAEG
jgi:hypothetical protein